MRIPRGGAWKSVVDKEHLSNPPGICILREDWGVLVYTASAGGGPRSLAGILELGLWEPVACGPRARALSETLQSAGTGREEGAVEGTGGPINQPVSGPSVASRYLAAMCR